MIIITHMDMDSPDECSFKNYFLPWNDSRQSQKYLALSMASMIVGSADGHQSSS